MKCLIFFNPILSLESIGQPKIIFSSEMAKLSKNKIALVRASEFAVGG